MIPLAALGIAAKVAAVAANPMAILEGLFHFFFETKTGRAIGIAIIWGITLLVAHHKGAVSERAKLNAEIVDVATKAATIEAAKATKIRSDLATLRTSDEAKDADLATLRTQLKDKAHAATDANNVCIDAAGSQRLRELRQRALRP